MNTERILSRPFVKAAIRGRLPMSRSERLREDLLATVDLIERHRADLISEGFVEDYVALNWLEWRGTELRLTLSGAALCDRIRAEPM